MYAMGRFHGSHTMRMRRANGLPVLLPRPEDFEATFLMIGRFACQEHYGVGRKTVTRWLEEIGKDRLIDERAELVRRKIEERKADKRLTQRDLAHTLAVAFPLPGAPSPETVQDAAHFLRQVRNGGWIVSPATDGLWWCGTLKRSAEDLVRMAEQRGFVRPSITDGFETKIG